LRVPEWTDTVLQALADGVIALDRAGFVQLANPAAEALLGRPLAGVHLDVPPALSLVGGRAIACTPTTVPEGTVLALRDVTAATIAARRAELADRRAEHASFAASLAHQINNPLAIINVHHELIKDEVTTLRARHLDETKPFRDLADSLTEMEAAVVAITHLTADLRAFSQVMPGAITNLRRAVEWAARTASPFLRDRARPVISLATEASIASDEPRLGRMLVHLLRNAAHAIPSGAPEHNEVSISSRAGAPRRIVVEIRDTGSGIAADRLPTIFAPHLTQSNGTIRVGLGLAECKDFIDSIGGTIAIESVPSQGTVVRLELPQR
jgi:signal transduction histidine kinase